MARARRYKVAPDPDKDLGTMTFKQDHICYFGNRYFAGQTVTIGRAMLSPVGTAHYKVKDTKTWVSTNDVIVNECEMKQRRTYRSIL